MIRLTFLLFVLVGRGGLEFVFPKSIAYVIQTLGVGYLIIFNMLDRETSKFKFIDLLLFFMFILINMISYFETIALTHFYQGIVYIFLMLIWAGIFLSVPKKGIFYKVDTIKINLIVVGGVLVFVAFLQQLNIIRFLSGESWFLSFIRPSSITGSYLHYPIVIFIIGFSLLQIYLIDNNSKVYVCIPLFFLISGLISFSRSFFFMTIIIILYILYKRYILRINFFNIMLFLVFILASFLIVLFLPQDLSSRLISTFSLHSSGNSTRLSIWLHAIDLIKVQNIFFGDYYGIFTNITKNMDGNNNVSSVVESSILQQVLNIGIIGSCIFYWFILKMFFAINKRYIILKGILLAFIIQSLTYQSIEIIPVFSLLFFCIIISNSLDRDKYYYCVHTPRSLIIKNTIGWSKIFMISYKKNRV